MADMARSVEPYTTRRGEQRFKVRYRLGTRQTSRTFTTHAGAREFARLLDTLGPAEADRIIDERIAAPDDTHTFGAFATHHIDTITGVQPDTRDKYRAYLRNDLTDLAPLPLTAITDKAIGRWVQRLEAAGASGKTIKNKHGFLSAVLDRAVAEKLIPANPAEGTRLPRTVTEPMVFLTPDEYTRFLGYFTPHWQPLVTTLFSTGLRWSEATALRVADVDLDAGTITVSRAWKKGGVIGPPKSEKARRTIAVAPETMAVLEPLVRDRPGQALVFTNTRGGPVRHNTFHENVWQPAVRLVNGEPAQQGKRIGRRRDAHGRVIEPATVPLGKRPRPHDARHSCASWLLASGIPINYVQAHLGHESITTTVDRYGHIMPAARQAVAGALSLALSAAHPQIEG